MSAITPLPKQDGFPFNYKKAREDRLARMAADSVFGTHFVDTLMQKYHRSELTSDRLYSDLMEYDVIHKRSIRSDPVYQLAYTSVLEQFEIQSKLIPYTTGAVPELPDFPNTKSPGLPYKLQGFKTKREVVDKIGLGKNRELWHRISFGVKETLPDVCLFARAQLTSIDKQKIRATWGYPIDVYLEEARFFYPVLDFVSSTECDFPIAYGFEMANGGMARLNATAIKLNGHFTMTDWSLFDKTIPPWLIRDAFSIVASLIDFGHVRDSEGKVWKVRSQRSETRWKKLVDYFVETPVRFSNGERFLVTGGVPSGSCFTNLIDTIVNAIVTRYLTYQTTGTFPNAEMYLGDDGVLFSDVPYNLEVMSALAAEKFGMVLNSSKSYTTQNPYNIHFLGYYNHHGFPFKPQDTLVASFIAPERTRTTVEDAATAALGQLYSGFDPIHAKLWVSILDFLNAKYPFSEDEILGNLQRTEGRHKYLKLVGIRVMDITYPKPIEGVYLNLLPKDRAKEVRVRQWNYLRLAQRSFEYWSESV